MKSGTTRQFAMIFLCKKINNLIKDILRNGYQAGSGKLELLKGNMSGYASIRFDKTLSAEAITTIIHRA